MSFDHPLRPPCLRAVGSTKTHHLQNDLIQQQFCFLETCLFVFENNSFFLFFYKKNGLRPFFQLIFGPIFFLLLERRMRVVW